MKLTLVCPTRTLLNIDSAVAFLHTDRLAAIVQRASKTRVPTAQVVPAPGSENGAGGNLGKFRTLDEYPGTEFTTPLVTFELPACELESVAVLAKSATLAGALDINSVRVQIFANTLAILVIDATLALPAVMANIGDEAPGRSCPGLIETALTNFTGLVASDIQRRIVGPFTRALYAEARAAGGAMRSVMRLPRDWKAYSEAASLAGGRHGLVWPEAVSPLMWCHRVFHLSTLADADSHAVARLFRVPPSERPFLAKWGTSYLGAQVNETKFLDMLVKAQYFSALYDNLVTAQRAFERTVSIPASRINLRKALPRADRILVLLVEIDAERFDFASCLQDVHAEIFAELQETFELDALGISIRKRIDASELKIKRVLDHRDMLNNRVFSFFLFFVGGAQLISLFISLHALHPEPQIVGGVPGIMNILHDGVSVNLTLNVLTVLLVALAVLYALTRGRSR